MPSLSFLADSGLDFDALLGDPKKAAGTMLEVNGEQRGKLKQMQASWPSSMSASTLDPDKVEKVDDWVLLRFLQADKYDVKKATERLLSTLRWWHEEGIASMEEPAAWHRYSTMLRPRVMNGVDCDGRPVMFEMLGLFIGTTQRSRQLSLSDWLQCATWELGLIQGLMLKSSQKLGKPVTTMTYVGDCAGLRILPCMRNMGLLKSLTETVEVHFPEIAGPFYIINAVPGSGKLWDICKRFLDPVVASKITIDSGVPLKRLTSTLDLSILPQYMGGTSELEVPTPAASLSDGASGEEFDEDLTLKAGESKTVTVHVESAVTEVTWRWCLEAHTIAHGVTFTPAAAGAGGEEGAVVVVCENVRDSEEGVLSGDFTCQSAGTLRLSWSNELSRWRSKRVRLSYECASTEEK